MTYLSSSVKHTCVCILEIDGNDTVVGVYVDKFLFTGNSTNVVGQSFDSMVSLQLKHLGVVGKFLGLRIMLDSEAGYVLEQGVVTDLLLKEMVWNRQTGLGPQLKNNAAQRKGKVRNCRLHHPMAYYQASKVSVRRLEYTLDCKMHPPCYLFWSAPRNQADSQPDHEGIEGPNEGRDISR